jgi:hypothetical protein
VYTIGRRVNDGTGPREGPQEGETMAKTKEQQTSRELVVCGKQVQVDRSGVGHCWVDVDADDLPAQIREEIECEIIDGSRETCEDYLASNGMHYRW